MLRGYATSLTWVPPASRIHAGGDVGTIWRHGLSVRARAEGVFPQQDTGGCSETSRRRRISRFRRCEQKLTEVVGIIKSDPAVASITGFTRRRGHSGTTNTGTDVHRPETARRSAA